MNTPRRRFLEQAALGVAGLAAAAAARGADSKSAPAANPTSSIPTLPEFDAKAPAAYWAAVRALYPLTPDLTYFNTGGLGPASSLALDVVTETTRRLQSRAEHGHNLLAGARSRVAKFLGAETDEIAFVRNASEGNSIVAAGLALKAGDEVIFESHAHPGGSFPWLNQAKLRGVVVKVFEPDTESVSGNLARIEALLTPRTRAVQVSHITAPTGIVLPVPEIARLCRSRGIWFHVDAAQSAGMIPISQRELGCDSFATSGHKWLGAPHETGLLWIKKERMEEVAAVHIGAYSGELEMLPGELVVAKTAMRHEYGTRNAAAILGLAEAIALQERIGPQRIAERGRALASRLRTGLQRVSGVEILTPARAELCASMITFRTPAVPFDKLFGRLLGEYKLRCRPVSEQKLNALRVSLHVFNSEADCDALIAAVEKIVKSA